MNYSYRKTISRRSFLRTIGAGGLFPLWRPGVGRPSGGSGRLSEIFHVDGIPDPPFMDDGNSHLGVEALLALLENWRLPFYHSSRPGPLAGPSGMIAEDDVVLIKVNAQWKCRGCTNSDVVRGLIKRILGHPDRFRGEVLIVDNGQGRGSLNCDNPNYGDSDVRANAVNGAHSFVHLVDRVFVDPRVSAFLLDPLRSMFIADDDHQTDGYRRFEDVSYPCFTTPGGRRVELREGIWITGRPSTSSTRSTETRAITPTTKTSAAGSSPPKRPSTAAAAFSRRTQGSLPKKSPATNPG